MRDPSQWPDEAHRGRRDFDSEWARGFIFGFVCGSGIALLIFVFG